MPIETSKGIDEGFSKDIIKKIPVEILKEISKGVIGRISEGAGEICQRILGRFKK